MADYGLTKYGFRAKTLAEITEELQISIRADLNHSTDTGPDSPIGRHLRIFATREADLWKKGEAVYQLLGTNGAEGVPLDNVNALVGVNREEATFSTVTATLFGTPATSITAGQKAMVSSSGEIFSLVSTVIIPAAGFVEGTFQADNDGPIRANAGTLDSIITPVVGWSAVINYSDASLGKIIQSDPDYRAAKIAKKKIMGASCFDTILAKMVDPETGVEDITDISGTMNVTDNDYTSTGGLPPHSLEIVVEGGDDQEIADKILELKPAGIQSYSGASGSNNISLPCLASNGQYFTENFSRREEVLVFLHYEIEVTEDFDQGNAQVDVVVVNEAKTQEYFVIINGDEYSYYAITTGGITAFADGGGGQVVATSASHNLYEGAQITITGTANYNGNYTISNVTTDSFEFTDTWVADDTGTWTKQGGVDTVASIASALSAQVNGAPWNPVTSLYVAGQDKFTIGGNYDGIPFVMSVTPTTSLTVSTTDHVSALGDQQLIIDAVLEKAEGDGVSVGLQTMGKSVLLGKYKGAASDVNHVVNIVSLWESHGSRPNVAPTASPWSESNVEITHRQIADLDSTAITVEVIGVV